MNVSTQALSSAVGQFAFLYGDVFTVNGTNIPCIPSSHSVGQKWEVEGGFAELDLTLYVSKSRLGTVEPESTLTYKGTVYRVKRISNDPDGVGIVLDCIAEF